jgi:hypothetical protein
MRVKDKIQRKMSSIKLPYFIEGLIVTELSLGQTPPLIHKASKPVLDERGLWVDLDVTYEGLVVLILQTKLNLMKLKQPHSNGESSLHHPTCFPLRLSHFKMVTVVIVQTAVGRQNGRPCSIRTWKTRPKVLPTKRTCAIFATHRYWMRQGYRFKGSGVAATLAKNSSRW